MPRQVHEKLRKPQRRRLKDFKLFELVFRVWWMSAAERERMGLETIDVDERLRLGQLQALERALAIRLIKATIELDVDTMTLVAKTLKSLRDEPVDRAVATYFALYGRGTIKQIREFVDRRLGWKIDEKHLSPARQKKAVANQKTLDRALLKFPFVRIRTRASK